MFASMPQGTSFWKKSPDNKGNEQRRGSRRQEGRVRAGQEALRATCTRHHRSPEAQAAAACWASALGFLAGDGKWVPVVLSF